MEGVDEEAMKTNSTLDERREFKRFRVKDSSSFVLSLNWPDKGTLVDISRGGFAFHYQAKTPWPDNLGDEYMVFGGHGSCLNRVPIEFVADREVPCGEGNRMMVRRRSVKFGELNQQQKFLLDCFIWINSTGQC